MGLVDFMQSLQDQDITYSPEPEQTIKVIPPEKSSVGIKIIPPETEVTTQKPLKIKLKLKTPVQTVQPTVQTVQPVQPAREAVQVEQPKPQVITIKQPQTVEQPTTSTVQVVQAEQSKPQVQRVEQPIEQPIEQPQIQQPPTKTKEELLEELFISSGTEDSKKSIWLEYYNRAKTSRKNNIIVERMKIGKFTITPDNKVLILPDYDVVRKDPDDILKDHWF